MTSLFKLRGELSRTTNLLLQISGVVFLLLVWVLLTVPFRAGSDESAGIPVQLDAAAFAEAESGAERQGERDFLVSCYRREAAFMLKGEAAEADLLQAEEILKRAGFQWPQTTPPKKMDEAAWRERLEALAAPADRDFFSALYTEQVLHSLKEELTPADRARLAKALALVPEKRALVQPLILPPPGKVFSSFGELVVNDQLVDQAFFSIRLNIAGYLEAVLIAVPLGFLIGLFPFFRGLFRKPIDALRFVPLTAVTGLFIAWFGIQTNMKVQFLAFGIIVYLLPVVVQRIDEVSEVFTQTIYTLGAGKWQTIRHVFIPAVFSKLSDDIRVLVAISWTYIIVAELVNRSEGGIGALAYTAARQSRIDKVFAILTVIIIIGFIQDRLFVLLDRIFFRHKHS